ncbi:ATP-binding protein [Actinotalea ferrariae]|uniref:ATP-binding protein n=1 Tax=Actinotalea ferrariae TaxID=1386098 RepID=UPI001C8B430D|nr:ATP-binding protein [Actinotalea ferrariae]MBX9245500.1 ATP-binding protein [Actinotalea ferrariae]
MTSDQQAASAVSFTVDAALLRELGARLVGQPHIALAELIKNSYDADARHVTITFDGHSIVLEDDGHGMSFDDFVQYWMRVGTTHKRLEQRSPELARAYTGSKGVGRLAAQLLATKLEVTSVALRDKATSGYASRQTASGSAVHQRITARVDWDRAVTEDELTSVTVPVSRDSRPERFANNSPVGTRLTMTGLTDTWDESSFRGLAQEIWALQPPFDVSDDDRAAFQVQLVSPYGNVVDEFGAQMQAIFDNWRSVIMYRLEPDQPDSDVLFEIDPLVVVDEDQHSVAGTIPQHSLAPSKLLDISILSRDRETTPARFKVRVVGCLLDQFECEIRVFNLSYRQANNVRVEDSRQYMAQFGGVHIYDGGFRLPYYGPQDWLDLERDHARRLSRSYLLPTELQAARQLHDLPSARRVFGTARISTAHEAQAATRHGLDPQSVLAIQVTRDRLVDNGAYRTLRRLIRIGLDLYADGVHRAPKLASTGSGSARRKPSARFEEARATLEAARDQLDDRVYQTLTDNIEDAAISAQELERRSDQLTTLLGSLATVGMTTLAWDHEASKQRHIVMDTSLRLREICQGPCEPGTMMLLAGIADELSASAKGMDDIASLFKPVVTRASRETVARIRAKPFIQATVRKLLVLGRGATVNVAIPDGLTLPAAPVAAWSAVVQNLVVNAFNAVLEQPRRHVEIDGGIDGQKHWIRVQDTGIGIDLKKAPTYFAPFVRGMQDDPRRSSLGLGGSGLGLTIVRMITEPLGVDVRFVEPDAEYATSVLLSWEATTK